MAYVHIAHDCQVGNETIFGPGATLGGHVEVDDFAAVSAYSGVHQFCRVGRHAFIGGYSVVTKDALPFARTVGARSQCRVYGLNRIGLVRRGFGKDTLAKLRQAYRYLLQSKLNATQALQKIEGDPRPRLSRGRIPGPLHPHRAARRHPQARQGVGRRSRRRTLS